MSADTKLLMQAVVVVKAISSGRGVMPLAVDLVEGTSAEYDAWLGEARKYLTAKREGRTYIPEGRNIDEEVFGD